MNLDWNQMMNNPLVRTYLQANQGANNRLGKIQQMVNQSQNESMLVNMLAEEFPGVDELQKLRGKSPQEISAIAPRMMQALTQGVK